MQTWMYILRTTFLSFIIIMLMFCIKRIPKKINKHQNVMEGEIFFKKNFSKCCPNIESIDSLLKSMTAINFKMAEQ